MSYIWETITVRPVTPRIGAEISGINIAAALSNRQRDEVHDALIEHLVLFFRNQRFTLESQKAFGGLFGELHIHPNTPGPKGHPEVLTVHADATSKRVAGEYWHSDVSCDPEPPMGSILHLHTVPPSGGDTLFASSYAAYDELSPRMKSYLEGLTALHSGERWYRRVNALHGVDNSGRVFPSANHPVVRTHPVTKRKVLFVNRGFTYRINGVPDEESAAILNFLFAHSERPEFQVRFRWEPEFGRLLGQSCRAAPGALGLLSGCAIGQPGHDQGGSTVLRQVMPSCESGGHDFLLGPRCLMAGSRGCSDSLRTTSLQRGVLGERSGKRGSPCGRGCTHQQCGDEQQPQPRRIAPTSGISPTGRNGRCRCRAAHGVAC